MKKHIITASPTIWNTSPYKVTVYPDEAEGNHKQRHISVTVHRDQQAGTISIKDGRVLAGNLSMHSVNWCINQLLTEQNKQRINIMIENKDFYRLDRTIQVKSHPLPNDIIISSNIKSWQDKLLLEVTYIDEYEFVIKFKDNSLKLVDIKPYIIKHKKMFQPILNDKNKLKNFKYDIIELYWNDLMGIEAQTLYDIGRNIEW